MNMRKLKYVKLFENFVSDEFKGKEVTIEFELSKDTTMIKLGNPGKSIKAIIGGIDKEERKVLFVNEKGNHIFTLKYYELESGEPAGFFEYDNLTNQKLVRVKESYQGKTLDNIRTKYNWN
jgi:hypothetical protein